ncbi:hypothetical protein AB1Y20_002364 [Prymnesium parvum]|uniref:Tyrosine-protein phosphatase domain-containing protein n=1 Tax=Prymnesium parvum TaxID=97485 RepID=A0AB34JAV1_PRYPA
MDGMKLEPQPHEGSAPASSSAKLKLELASPPAAAAARDAVQREAQQLSLPVAAVRDCLLVGRTAACLSAEGAAALRQLRVSHVVAVTVEPSATAAASAAGLGVLQLDVVDDIDAPLHAHLDAAAAFLHAAVGGGAAACVCCSGGASAGPAVAMYYLMRHGGLSLAEALDEVSAALPAAQPNIGFIQRLIEAEAWLRGALAPSLTIQQYKWRFLQRLFPDAERQRIFEALHGGRHEIARLLS